jgi:hypothetical protein
VVGGPLRPGWAARAGTPERLLAASVATAATPRTTSPSPTVRAPLVLPSQTTGSGVTRLHRLAGNQARVVVALHTSDVRSLAIRVVLNGQQIAQGISMSDGSVVLTPPQGAAAYSGSVTGLDGGNIAATLSDGHGDRIVLTLALQITSSGSTSAQVSIQGLESEGAQV